MIQQVNLYRDILSQERTKPIISLYWIALPVVIVLLFAGFTVYLTWHLKSTEAAVQQFRRNLENERTRVNLISTKSLQQSSNTQLAAEVMQWQNRVDELTQTLQLLSGNSNALSPGFSNYFLALSNRSTPDVWLSALYFNERQKVIRINGSTFNPEKIPYFLQQLQKESIFNGYSFAKLTMQQSEKVPKQMDFKLSTIQDIPNKEDHVQ
ncbi:hypothetical protein [Candidatus Methylobacter oryzae]|uniref:PilN domain-containing protein n=1 Tax=Candidatus Methylobacter oryzae TaxID=2497749 RepID=A0ABY3CFG0_9GAMM|nr:hypothetical protein [Candidatus Methylobacter oryzae]TRX02315.1 hypothetical protein EKO24_002795 [Candidatus Methylobacter oryzae]